MGQYFNLANDTKKVNISEGKMVEWYYIGCQSVELAMSLLSTTWKRNRIITAGDYAYNEIPYKYDNIKSDESNIDYLLSENGYIYNVTKQERISMKQYTQQAKHFEEDHHIIHPLPLITKSEDEGGGGDYENDYDEMLGAWSGDVLFVSYSNLKRYKDITHLVYHEDSVYFNEHQEYLRKKEEIKNIFFLGKKIQNF